MLRDLFSLFPAYAGVILKPNVKIGKLKAFPRIRGGDPQAEPMFQLPQPFSPHTRG